MKATSAAVGLTLPSAHCDLSLGCVCLTQPRHCPKNELRRSGAATTTSGREVGTFCRYALENHLGSLRGRNCNPRQSDFPIRSCKPQRHLHTQSSFQIPMQLPFGTFSLFLQTEVRAATSALLASASNDVMQSTSLRGGNRRDRIECGTVFLRGTEVFDSKVSPMICSPAYPTNGPIHHQSPSQPSSAYQFRR
jgi:hypothetical protein